MALIFSDRFKRELKCISDFIAKDNIKRAVDFENELISKIENLADNPKQYRASYYVDNSNARDLIFKGYTIPYLVDDEIIIILGIFKSNLWKL
ncbi:type II toxin-antitoxin system RelE/ParE family toxin [Campylobacter sputorum]|uniref:type II toxin-antitoxin system RelE/ParE family toxin n=1 Tax=Campylobacter sputorum TaxID=206 RepID=UPI00053BFEB6|nr:type II toxin-antitoxin system RelE/ParE family toxin [Campylobacter sputorum]